MENYFVSQKHTIFRNVAVSSRTFCLQLFSVSFSPVARPFLFPNLPPGAHLRFRRGESRAGKGLPLLPVLPQLHPGGKF